MLNFAYSFIADYWFDFRYGTETSRWIPTDQLDTTSQNKNSSSRYQPTKVRPFRKLMANMVFPENSVFVDVGCGKGKVLLMASEYSFKKIIGIDFSRGLCEIAKKNIAFYCDKVGHTPNIEVVESDILDYPIGRDENVWFLYNPFDGHILEQFLQAIEQSLNEHPREIWLIYHIPEQRAVLEGRESFTKKADYMLGGVLFEIYTNQKFIVEKT